ncbi:MAG: pyruvate dehydrogenase (acetyl-transferring) E1 component subunit alpha [Myxococcales bacterium]|nr:pyruvate dehydrogenase (acetyl-transferring) E1 component subunit alpha [Myxococcales bacterium]
MIDGRERALAAFEQMVLIRRFEEKCAEVYSTGKIRGFLHLYIGEEAVAVGVMAALSADDNVVATYREHGHALARGLGPGSVMAEMYGKATGCSRGRGGSMHLFSTPHRFFGGHAIVGGGLPVAVGLALADSMLGHDRVTVCFFGDGAVDEGEFHESMNLAALWRLPVLFVCENNLYAMGTALERHESLTDLCVKPRAYGIPAENVDGMDLFAVEAAAQHAVSEVRRHRSPFFLEAKTYRFRAHSMYDAEAYRSREEVAEWAQKHDPIDLAAAQLERRGLLDPAARAAIEDRVRTAVQQACDEADAAPLEPVADLLRDVLTPEAR